MKDAPILETLGTDVVENLMSRRDVIAKSGKFGGMFAAGLALGSAPIAIAALATDAYGQQAGTDVLGTLQFALLLENLESEFYKAVLGTSTVAAFNAAFAPVRATLTATEVATFQLISKHEIAHVAFLSSAITGAGGVPTRYDPASTFDFTGGRGTGTGPFAPAASDKGFLLIAAQIFEDTGVRAYKGQAGNLLRTGDTLQAALQIHSVEARHAARIRRMRKAAGAPAEVRAHGVVDGEGTIASGVPGATALPLAVQLAVFGAYAGEGNHSHVVNNGSADVTLNVDTIANLVLGPDTSEAFDEPLTRGQVYQMIRPFVIPGLP